MKKLERIKYNKYAWKVYQDTKDLAGLQKYANVISGGVSEIVKHKFHLWDYIDVLKGNNYTLKLENGVAFYLPYCRYFDTIQMTIARDNNFYAKESLNYLREKYIRPGMNILDIGANIGNHSIFFAKRCGAAHVYSFEPQKDVFDILKKNIALNHLEDICTVYNFALGSDSGNAKIAAYNRANCGEHHCKWIKVAILAFGR